MNRMLPMVQPGTEHSKRGFTSVVSSLVFAEGIFLGFNALSLIVLGNESNASHGTTRYRTFKEGIYISCKLACVRRRLLSWLQRSFSDCIGKAIFCLKHSGSLMLNIHCVIWEKLSLTNTISFPSANSRILKTEIVETTEMLQLIDQEIFLRFIHNIY